MLDRLDRSSDRLGPESLSHDDVGRRRALLEEITTFEDILSTVRKIKTCLSLPFIVDGQELLICSRIGISLSTCGHGDETTLLETAARAVGQARANGYGAGGLEGNVMTSHAQSVPTLTA